MRQADAIVVGGGLAGLMTASMAAGRGLSVTVLESDGGAWPPVPGAVEGWHRPGVPHMHQTHGFLSGFHRVLRRELPEVLDALVTAGAEVRDHAEIAAGLGYDTAAAAELSMLLVRRSTVELHLLKSALTDPLITVHRGQQVQRITVRRGRVVGASSDRDEWVAPVVIDATGRRRTAWSAYFETVGSHPGELAYITRMYRLRDLSDRGPMTRLNGAGVVGDGYNTVVNLHEGGLFSSVLACGPRDRELLRAREEMRYEAMMRSVPITGPWIGRERAVPVSPPRVMSNMGNELREVSRNAPAGFFAVGDALATTDPARGFGASAAAMGAAVVTQAIAHHAPDLDTARETAGVQIEPWLRQWHVDTVRHTTARAERWTQARSDGDVELYGDVPQSPPAHLIFQLGARGEQEWLHKRRYQQMLCSPRSLEVAHAERYSLHDEVPTRVQRFMDDVPLRRELLAVVGGGRTAPRGAA